MKKFKLGQVVATPGVATKRDEGLDIQALIARHMANDWGDICDEDKHENDLALEERCPNRLLSSYDTDHGKIWIITEWDRSVTTILLPEEY